MNLTQYLHLRALLFLRAQSPTPSPRPRTSTESKTPCPPMFSPRRSPRLRVSALNSPSRVPLPFRRDRRSTQPASCNRLFPDTPLPPLPSSRLLPNQAHSPNRTEETTRAFVLQSRPLNSRKADRGRPIHRKEAPSQNHRHERRPGMRGVSPRQGSGRIGRSQSERHARQCVRLHQKWPGREDIRDARDARQARPAWLLVSAPGPGNSDRPDRWRSRIPTR